MSNAANLRGGLDSTPDDNFDIAARWHSLMEDGKPSPAERERFEAWLAADPKNRTTYESIERTWAGMASAAVDDRILMIRREALNAPQKKRSPWWRPLSIAASILVVVAVAAGMLIRYSPLTAQGDTTDYVTQVGERSTIILADGSNVVLNTASRIHVAFDAQARRVRLLAGQAWFEVAKDQPRPFIVEAGDRIVTAHGTAFDVRIEDHDRVQVTLIEGRVSVEANSSKSGPGPNIPEHQDLLPGDQLIVTAARPAVMRKTDVAKATSWREGQIIFDDDTLEAAVAEVNRYSRKKLILDPRLAKLRMSGVFIAGHSDSFVQTVTGHFPIKVTPDGEGQLLLTGAD
jgi:transmembrane sensor